MNNNDSDKFILHHKMLRANCAAQANAQWLYESEKTEKLQRNINLILYSKNLAIMHCLPNESQRTIYVPKYSKNTTGYTAGSNCYYRLTLLSLICCQA